MRKFHKIIQNLQNMLLFIHEELQSFAITVTQIKTLSDPVVIDLDQFHQLIQQVDTLQQ